MAASSDLRQILSPARFNTLSSDIQSVLIQAWNTHTGNLKSELEKTKVDAEQKISVLEKKNKDLEGKLATFQEESEKDESALCLYREQATASGVTAARLTDQNSKLAAERDELRRQFNNARAERDDISGLCERRGEEIERMHAKIRQMTEEVSSAVSAKCEAQARLEDLDTKEMNISFKEKRFNEEKVFLESQIELLKEEVDRRNEEVLSAKRDAGVRHVELSQELAEKTEELRASLKREEACLEDSETYKRRAEKLNERLREARESECKLEDNYRAELKSQTKLTELYRQQGEENTQKTEELSNAVTSLQRMVKEAEEKYGKLESQLEVVKADHKVEIEAKNEAINALNKELEEANKLIKTVKDKGLTEDAIDHLSPSAAQASRLLKSGITLTGIYAQMVNLSEELTAEKEENKRINSYMDHILLEIEERAPILRQQREDYERAVSALGGLTENLEAAREEVELRRREAEEARRAVNTLEKDRDRLEQQVSDLGRQTAVLVKEVEAARCGGQVVEPLQTLDMSTTESVIDGRLLTFRDVTELQQKNIELLAVVRQLSENRDQAESTLVQEKTAEVRQELDTALRQAEELRSARERQQLMVENIIQQRDLYKSMCANKETSLVPGLRPEAKQSESPRVGELEAKLEEVQKEFADYKQDKAENYNMLDAENKKLREELLESRCNAAKLASHEEYNNERFNIAQANCASFKKQIEALESRNSQLDNILAKHESSIASLRDELMKSTRKLSNAELKVDQLTQSNSHLKSVESRLTAEIQVLQRERNTSSQIMANLQQIQINLEHREDEARIRLQESNAKLSEELALMRKKREEDDQHFKASVKNWDNKSRELQERVQWAEDSQKKASEGLSELSKTNETLKEELKEKEEMLALAESRLTGRGQLASQASTTEGDGKTRYRDVEILLGKSKQEIRQLNNQLAAERKKVDEFKMISEAAEKRMIESNNTMTDFKNDTDKKIKNLETEKGALEKKSTESNTLIGELRKKIEDLEAEVGTNGGELREKFKLTTVELQAARDSMAELEKQDQDLRNQLLALADESKEAQEKYERELLLHAKDIETLNTLKADSQARNSNLEEVELEKKRAEDRVQEIKDNFEAESARLTDDLVVLKEQVANLTGENKVLLDQVESMSGQLVDLSNTAHNVDTSGLDDSVRSINRSVIEDDDSREQLVAIIKHIRRGKEIVDGRLEAVSAELARTQRQLESAQNNAQDAQAALEAERNEANENLMTAGKHAELVRKVESLAAITDSNKLLREERDRLAAVVDTAHTEASLAKEKLVPLQNKMKEMEDKIGVLVVEKTALQTECEGWKRRSDQLVEKSFKMNPEELKRLQEAETRLSKMVQTLNFEKKQLQAQSNNANKELGTAKQNLATVQAELKKEKKDMEDKSKELKALLAKDLSTKNQLSNLTRQNNEHKKKIDELEKAKAESLATINKQKSELSAAQTKANEARSGSEEAASLRAKVAEAEKQKVTLHEELAKTKINIKSLKNIGRNYREKHEKNTAELQKSVTEMATLTEKLKKAESDLAAKEEELLEARKLVGDAHDRFDQVENEKDKKIAELETRNENVEERAKRALETAKTKIGKLQIQVKDLQALQNNESDTSLIEEKNREIEQAKEEKERLKSAMESQLAKLRTENTSLKNKIEELTQEKKNQQEQLDQMQSAKLVAVAGVVHQQEPRKQAQPQAHIQPHRHTPRDEHRPPQTASIRPMTQRSAPAVVLPTSQANVAQPEIATVQPTVSVSPSVSSAPQVPSTSQLDPSAQEFIPMDRSSSTDTMEQADESSRGGSLRMEAVQASTSAPSGSGSVGSSGQTSTSGGGSTQTTASVPPTLKRTRQNLEAELGSDEPEPGPSGLQKRARTAAEEVADDQLTESDGEETAGTETSSNQGAGALASSSQPDLSQDETEPVNDDDQEEGEISDEDDEDEDEVGDGGAATGSATTFDALAEEETESGMDQEDIEADNTAPAANNPEMAEVEEEGDEEDEEVLVEGTADEEVEESVSEPSSSAGLTLTTSQRPQQFLASSHAAVAAPGLDNETVEDSVVPGTPKLAEPRRPPGSSEAVSSPQVPVAAEDRFLFGGSSGTSHPSSSDNQLVQQEGAERTSVDISQLSQDKDAPQAASPQAQVFPEDIAAAIEDGGDMEDTSPIVDPEPSEAAGSALPEPAPPRAVEEGVSSSGAEVTSRPPRKQIVWTGSQERPASTSPQRSLNRAGIARSSQSGVRGMRGGKKRGT